MGVSENEVPVIDVGGAAIVPYLPRITLDWLRDAPGERHRALNGTMAFVDISGFTAMSERLAPKGRLGAEEVTDVMSATFGRLLAVAYELGGGLLKLGGDALLLFFDGDGHAARACAAAWGMRDSLDALGPLETSVGPVELKMHVGVHSGDFDFFLVGSRHRELIVAGPDAVVTVEMEDTAEAGEIAVSEATAAYLSAASLGDRKGAGTLLSLPPTVAFTGIAGLPDTSDLDLLACIPEELRAHLVAERVESEHRQAAVAFVRFGGVEALDDRRRSRRWSMPCRKRPQRMASASSRATSTRPAGGSSSSRACRPLPAATRSACSARCARRSTPARGCRCTSAWPRATSSPAASGRPTDRRSRSSAAPPRSRPG